MSNFQTVYLEIQLLRKPVDIEHMLSRHFVNRDEVLVDLDMKLHTFGAVLIHGWGGTGKTTIASHFAHNRLKSSSGSVLFVSIGEEGIDPRAFFSTVNDKLRGEVNHSEKIRGEDRVVLQHLLKGGSGYAPIDLIVIDDNVQLGRAFQPVIEEIVQDTRVSQILVLSRRQYSIKGLKQIDVSSMSSTEANKLLLQHSSPRTFSEEDTLSLEQLVNDKLERHALAVRMAGKLLQEPTLTPTRLLTLINEKLETLADESPDLIKQHRSIRAMVETMVDQLDQETYEAFLGFGALFGNTTTVELMNRYLQHLSILDCDAMTPPGALRKVADHGLAKRIPRYAGEIIEYVTHPLFYEYAEKALRNKTLSNPSNPFLLGLQCCIDYFEHYLLATDYTDTSRLAHLKPELENLFSAIAWATESTLVDIETAEKLLQICDRLYLGSSIETAHGLYFLHNQPLIGMHLMKGALGLARKQKNTLLEAAYLGNYGKSLRDTGDYESAVTHYDGAIEIATGLESEGKSIVAWNLVRRGIALRRMEIFADARDSLNTASDLLGKLGNWRWLSICHNNLGSLHLRDNDYDAAIQSHQQALDYAIKYMEETTTSDPYEYAISMRKLGTAQRRKGEADKSLRILNEARKNLEASLDILRGISYAKSDVSAALGNLALVYRSLATNLVEPWSLESLSKSDSVTRDSMLSSLRHALDLHQEAHSVNKDINDIFNLAVNEGNWGYCLHCLALLENTENNFTVSETKIRSAIEHAEEINSNITRKINLRRLLDMLLSSSADALSIREAAQKLLYAIGTITENSNKFDTEDYRFAAEILKRYES